MKQFQSKLDKLYEGLHLKKTYIPETQKPDFKSNDNPFTLNSILRRVYDSIEQTLKAGRNEDFSDKEKLDDYEKLFKDVLHVIDTLYAGEVPSTFTPETKHEPERVTLTPPGIPQKDIGGKGTFEISVDQSTLIVNIDDVEDRIDIGELNDLKTGKPVDINSTAGMIRIRARLEALLRKMGYDVGGPFVPDNEYEVKVNHNNKTFKLVRKPGR